MTEHIRNELNEIPIPPSLHSRAELGIEEAKKERKGQNSIMKFHKKMIAAAAAVVLAVGVFAGSNTALAKDIRGYFSDVFRFDGAVVGTEYNDATQEILFSELSCRTDGEAESFGLRVTFKNSTEAPFRFIEELSMHDVTITDGDGREVCTIADTEPVPVVDGSVYIILPADLSSHETYTLRCTTLRGHAKAEAPLDIHGTWECSFTAP